MSNWHEIKVGDLVELSEFGIDFLNRSLYEPEIGIVRDISPHRPMNYTIVKWVQSGCDRCVPLSCLQKIEKKLDKSDEPCYNYSTTKNHGDHMNIKTCIHCEDTFSLESEYKRRVGGRINECPDCVVDLQTEISETIRAVSSGDGKMACIQILKFQSEDDAELYRKGWDQWSGWNNQRSGSVHDVAFTKVGENSGNSNSKGKA